MILGQKQIGGDHSTLMQAGRDINNVTINTRNNFDAQYEIFCTVCEVLLDVYHEANWRDVKKKLDTFFYKGAMVFKDEKTLKFLKMFSQAAIDMSFAQKNERPCAELAAKGAKAEEFLRTLLDDHSLLEYFPELKPRS